MLCYNSQLTTTLYMHKDKLGNKNLQFAKSVLRKFRVDATTHKAIVGPAYVLSSVSSSGVLDVK
jgi:hypothetical protein